MSDEELEELHADLRKRAEQTLDDLEARRAARKGEKSGLDHQDAKQGRAKRDAA